MGEYDDFRVILTPDLTQPGAWSVLLDECKPEALAGAKGTARPVLTVGQLRTMRSRSIWANPDADTLRKVGQDVWQSVMTHDLATAFYACLAFSRSQGKGTRLVFSMIGEDGSANPAGGAEPQPTDPIQMREMPLEALYDAPQNYLAPSPLTPVSRNLKFKPDRDPLCTPLPLRLLVVAAAPKDKPDANIQDEVSVIETALKKLKVPGGPVEVEYCDPPTRPELTSRLQKKFHILHFIGHGAYAIVGNDPSPRPHLCLEDETPQKYSDPMDAETLELLLQNSDIRLVVLTACSSATPTPEEVQATIGPFDGVAQRLVGGPSSISAVVAMQFDLEAKAAVTFSKTLYTHLLDPKRKLDEVVTLCRQSLVGAMNAGHRAWVTPVVYWRCKNGKVFDIQPFKSSLDEEAQEKLNGLKTVLDILLSNIRSYLNLSTPGGLQAAALVMPDLLKKVNALLSGQADLLGETLRLQGGTARMGETLPCPLYLRLLTPAQIGSVQVKLRYSADRLVYKSIAPGTATAPAQPLAFPTATGELTVILQNPSQGMQWEPDVYELAQIQFELQAGASDPVLEINLVDSQVQKDGAQSAWDAVQGLVLVNG